MSCLVVHRGATGAVTGGVVLTKGASEIVLSRCSSLRSSPDEAAAVAGVAGCRASPRVRFASDGDTSGSSSSSGGGSMGGSQHVACEPMSGEARRRVEATIAE